MWPHKYFDEEGQLQYVHVISISLCVFVCFIIEVCYFHGVIFFLLILSCFWCVHIKITFLVIPFGSEEPDNQFFGSIHFKLDNIPFKFAFVY